MLPKRRPILFGNNSNSRTLNGIYSLRLVNASLLNSKLFEIKRTSDNDVVSVKADPSIGFLGLNSPLVGSTSLLSSFITGTNGFIRYVRNQGNPKYPDAFQLNDAKQPQIAENGALFTASGKPMIKIASESTLDITSSFGTSGGSSYFLNVVAYNEQALNNGCLVTVGSTGSGAGYGGFQLGFGLNEFGNTAYGNMLALHEGRAWLPCSLTNTQGLRSYSLVNSGRDIKFKLNSELFTRAWVSHNKPLELTTIGGYEGNLYNMGFDPRQDRYYTGFIGEVLIHNTPPRDEDVIMARQKIAWGY